jgi:hypothetical protein
MNPIQNGLKEGNALLPCFSTLLWIHYLEGPRILGGTGIEGTHCLLFHVDDVILLGET